MKQGWTYKKLGEVAKISSGKSIPSSEINSNFSDGLYPCFGGNGIRGYVNHYSYDGLYPIVGRVGALCGNVHLSQGRFYATEHALVVSLKTNDNPKYIEHTLTHLNLRNYAKGIAQPVLSASTLSAINIPIPPLAEQERIVAELDLLSSIIDKKKAQLKEYNTLAQSIFFDMFGATIEEKGWEVSSFGRIMTLAKSNKCKSHSDLPILSITMHGGIVRQEDRFKKIIASKDVTGYKIIKRGQLVIAFPIDEGLIYTQDIEDEGIMSPAYNVWDVDYTKVSTQFLKFHLHSPIIMKYYKDKLRGTTLRRRMIPKEDLLNLPIPLPPLPLQQEFASKIEAIERQKSLIQQSIVETQMLFDSRMEHWFN